MPSTTMTPRQWWRRAVAAVKDKRSLCLVRICGGSLSSRRRRRFLVGDGGSSQHQQHIRHNPDLDAAVIKATSHDVTGVDYKNAGRVFAWARTSPAVFLRPLMWALSRRVEKTRCWAVALKSLMLAHGILLLFPSSSSSSSSVAAVVGRLPFDLSAFRDRSSWALSAFVRAYFNFLDQRSAFLSQDAQGDADEDGAELRRLERMQELLEMLMQVRPYGDEGAAVRLVLEAMDCVVLESFDIYSDICNGIARSLVGIFGGGITSRKCRVRGGGMVGEREKGMMGIRVLRRSAEQSSQLSAYFELCRTLGVLNAADLPSVQSISKEDIGDLERLLLLGGIPGRIGSREEERIEEEERGVSGRNGIRSLRTVVTKEWVLFHDDELAGAAAGEGHSGMDNHHHFHRHRDKNTNPFLVGSGSSHHHHNGLWEFQDFQIFHPKSPNTGQIGFGPLVTLENDNNLISLI